MFAENRDLQKFKDLVGDYEANIIQKTQEKFDNLHRELLIREDKIQYLEEQIEDQKQAFIERDREEMEFRR